MNSILNSSMRIVATLFLSSAVLSARIGESLEQCEARYGEADLMDDGSYHFSKSEFKIEAEFYKGRCVEIVYDLDFLKPIPLLKIQSLLRENSDEVEWVLPEQGDGMEWESTDGKLWGFLGQDSGTLWIEDVAGYDAMLTAATAKKKAEGLASLKRLFVGVAYVVGAIAIGYLILRGLAYFLTKTRTGMKLLSLIDKKLLSQ